MATAKWQRTGSQSGNNGGNSAGGIRGRGRGGSNSGREHLNVLGVVARIIL